MSHFKFKLGFVGAGNMAEAIARGAVGRHVLPADSIAASDPSEARRAVFDAMGVTTFERAEDIIASSEQVLLAVKPQVFPQLGDVMSALDRERQVVISIMAGITIASIEAATGGPTRAIRVMPNTPLMVGKGMSGIAVGEHAGDTDETLCVHVLRGCGDVAKVTEADLDAVTAISGSGPAYLFLLAEAMQAAAIDMGLLGCHQLFVNQTIAGAAEMLMASLDTIDSPEDLRRKVTSPGGTTQAAIEHFQSHGFEQLVKDAIAAARDRSIELGKADA
ncbi:MAG: pyrroline-5-carboxylate reductase [Planctomycetota bacterium]